MVAWRNDGQDQQAFASMHFLSCTFDILCMAINFIVLHKGTAWGRCLGYLHENLWVIKCAIIWQSIVDMVRVLLFRDTVT